MGDTRPRPTIRDAAKGADVLIHESTFSDDAQERGLETRPSTAREAAKEAQDAQARRLVLTQVAQLGHA